MKTTFLLRDGLVQVVLHPETKTERAVLDLIQSGLSVDVHRAQFVETQAGFVRQLGLGGHSFVGSDHLPDTVLVLRPVETQACEVVEKFPDNADLCKRTDGTWVYRDHTGTWRPCPSPMSADMRVSFPPDDMCTYFRRLTDDTWQVYDRQSRDWCPTTGQPEVAGWTHETEQLRSEMAAVLEHCVKETGFDAETKLKAIRAIVETALGRDRADTTHVGGGRD